MKKLLAMLMAGAMLLSFAACGDKKEEETTAPEATTVADAAGEVAGEDETAEAETEIVTNEDGETEVVTKEDNKKEDDKKERNCTVLNLFDKDRVNINYLVPRSESRKHKASDEPMWNQEMMEAYCKQIGHVASRHSSTTGEKITYLRIHGRKLAEMNGWVFDENKTKLNHNNKKQRVIFRSAHFRNDDCYLSIDFEKEDFHFELLNHRGKHLREINWHGDTTGGADFKHDIRLKR